MLVPLVAGRLALPRVEIRAQQQQRGEGQRAVTCETDYTSQGETVMVVADVKRTTVDLQALGQAGGGAVLVASEARSGEVVG